MSSAVKLFNIVRNILNKSMFDENVIQMILKYYWKDLKNKRKVLLDWINIEWLSWDLLSANPNAIDLLENNQDKINWRNLSNNKNAIKLLENNQNKIYWAFLCYNPNAIDLIKKRIKYENTLSKKEYDNLLYFKKTHWYFLCENKNAMDLLKNNKDKIDWKSLSNNPSIFEDEPMPTI